MCFYDAGNFGTVFVDQSYWQCAVAAKPSQGVWGFLVCVQGVSRCLGFPGGRSGVVRCTVLLRVDDGSGVPRAQCSCRRSVA